MDDYKFIEYNKDFIRCRLEISLGWVLRESGEWERVIIVSAFNGETDTLYSQEGVEADIDDLTKKKYLFVLLKIKYKESLIRRALPSYFPFNKNF